MNQDEWDNHWKGWRSYLREHSLRRLRTVLRPLLKGKIADIGCGVTDMYGPDDDVTGVDISPLCARLMQERMPTGTWIAADAAATGLPSNTYDTVVCSHVLEHFYDQQPIIEELKRSAKPEGNIIIAVPRRSVGADHIHPQWNANRVEDRIASHLRDATFSLMDHASWVVQGKPTATAAVVMIAWSPDTTRLNFMTKGVESLRRYTRYPYTWVVVDNGPAEQTEYVKECQPDIHLINKVNQRPPVARNLGAAGLSTDYIAFVDNDVQFYDGWLTDSIQMLEDHPDDKLIASQTNCKVLRRNSEGTLGKYRLSSFGASTCWVMRRRTFEEVGRWEEHDSIEDYDYAVRAGLKGYRFIYRDARPYCNHLGLHKRTFQMFERFVNGRWLPDMTDRRGVMLSKRLLLSDEAKKRRLPVFIETGTGRGDTLKTILATNIFEELHTVELRKKFADLATRRFRHIPNVHCYCHASTAAALREILGGVKQPVLYWLHAQLKGCPSPRLEELAAVLDHDGPDDVVLISDADGYDGKRPGWPAIAEIEALVQRKRPEWTVHIENNVIFCHAHDETTR